MLCECARVLECVIVCAMCMMIANVRDDEDFVVVVVVMKALTVMW